MSSADVAKRKKHKLVTSTGQTAKTDAIIAANLDCHPRMVQDVRLGKKGVRNTELTQKIRAELRRIEEEYERFWRSLRRAG